MSKEISNNEILKTIQVSQSAILKEVRKEFQDVREEIKEVRKEVKDVRKEVKDIRKEVKDVQAFSSDILDALHSYAAENDKRFTKIESQMVTKDYLDEKLADLRGDMVVLMRKEDTKFFKLVDILTERNVITKDDVKKLKSMEPFPQLSL